MQFVDEAVIEVTGGHGGKGCISFRREAHVPLGGPDGGDGGHGGNIVAVASTSVATLLDHRYKRFYRAEQGHFGEGARKSGADAPDIRIPVPVGTQVLDEKTGALGAATPTTRPRPGRPLASTSRVSPVSTRRYG
jgi:GTP-binding protein